MRHLNLPAGRTGSGTSDDRSRIGYLLPLALTVLFWPVPDIPGTTSIDDSWRVALHLAAQWGLKWGSEVSFTYGPLGFLGYPEPYVGTTSSIAFAFSFGVYAALAVAIWHATSARLPAWLAVVMLVVSVRLFAAVPVFEAAALLAFAISVQACLHRQRVPWVVFCLGAATATAVLTLGKFNIGLFVGAMGLMTTAAVARRSAVGAVSFLCASGIATVMTWLLIGQEIGGLPRFLADSIDLARGYSDAMAASLFPAPFVLETLFILCIAVIAIGVRSLRIDWSRRQMRLVLLLTITIAFALWKASFVRADTHVIVAFAALPIAAAVLLSHGTRAAVTGAVWIVLVLTSELIGGVAPQRYVDGRGVADFAAEASWFVPELALKAANATRANLRSGFALEPEIVDAISGQRISVDPLDLSIAYAYPEASWLMTPTLQSYVAYTKRLDIANAEFFRRDAAPARILRGAGSLGGDGLIQSIDGRNPWFESPMATLEIMCRYREIVASNQWQVLARGRNRCGDPTLIATVSAMAGQTVAVPSAGERGGFVVARISGLEPSVLDSLRSTVWRGIPWFITLDQSARYRLIAGTASDGLLMAVPSAVTSSGSFSFGPPTRTLAVSAGEDGRASSAVLTFEFLSVPWLEQP